MHDRGALTQVAAWPRVVYAVPEPDAELRDCMQALFARFQEFGDVPESGRQGGLEQRKLAHHPERQQSTCRIVLDQPDPTTIS